MRTFVALAILAAAPAAAQSSAPFSIDGRGFATLQEAADAVKDGSATILIAPGVYTQCVVQSAGRIAFRAAQPGTAVFDGTTCEGKAAFVLHGQGTQVDGIVFRNMRVGDGNGAGIRIETGDLDVTNSMFLSSQEGILGGGEAQQRMTIDHSTFAGLGQCDETSDCAHSIYLGNKGHVSITNSRFERGRGGHYVKLRVPSVTITGNSFDDTGGHKTNYMIDLPNGSVGLIAGNTFVQGPDKENHSALIVVAAEARQYRSAGLRIESNDARLSPGDRTSPAFVADISHQQIALANNRLGAGIRPFEQR